MVKKGNALDTKKGRDFISQFNLKRVVEGRGHDTMGLLADLYIKGRKMAEFNDDGWGGEVDLTYESAAKETELKSMVEEINFGQLMFDNGWDFMESADRISIYDQVVQIVELAMVLKEEAKLMKKTKGKLIITDGKSYRELSWKGVKDLAQLPTKQLQTVYYKYKLEFKKGEKYLNTDEQLLGLGIKL